MQSHILAQPATTKLVANVFVFKSGIEKEGLPRTSIPPWAQEVSGSNRDAPATNSLNWLSFRLTRHSAIASVCPVRTPVFSLAQ